ncbi:MAG: TRAP transporter large permease [Chloroflexota bacterium]
MSSSLFIWPVAIGTAAMFCHQAYHMWLLPRRGVLVGVVVAVAVALLLSGIVALGGPDAIKSNASAFLVLGFILLMVMNVPISFAMGIASVGYILAVGDIPQRIIPQRIENGMESFILVAIPLFVLAGSFMELGGMSRRFVNFAMVIIGHVRGGLAMVTVLAEYLFSGISGSSAADISAVGAVVIPSLKKSGYSAEESVAVVASASAMGILVPPAIIMVLLAALTQQSVITMFMAGFIPAIVMAAVLMALIYVKARRGNWPSQPRPSLRQAAHATVDVVIPGFTAVIIFGGILLGIMTVTEVAVAAAIYSLLVAVVVYREVKPSQLMRIFEETGSTTGMVFWKLGTATLFAWLLTIQKVPDAITEMMIALGGGTVPFIILTILFVMVLSALMDNVPVTIIFAPILFPVAKTLGINAIHYAIVMVAAGGIGIFLPPVGICFVLGAVIGGTTVDKATRPFMPYFIALLIGLGLVAFVPWLTLVVPSMLGMK